MELERAVLQDFKMHETLCFCELNLQKKSPLPYAAGGC